MSTLRVKPVPSAEVLERGIRAIGTTRSGAELSRARVISRRENWYVSTFATELVTVRAGDVESVVFCKHGEDYVDDHSGFRRGPGYEAEVYKAAVSRLGTPAPRWYGSFAGDHGSTLVVGFVRNAERVNEAETPGAMVEVAGKLGEHHRRCAAALDDPRFDRLNRYGGAHFDLWLERSERIPQGSSFSGAIGPLLPHQSRVVEILAATEPTFVHGELFPSNVLLSAGDVTFVDWESAGVGPGEIDVAALTVGWWPEETRRECEHAYARARWGCTPAGARKSFAAARLYLCAILASQWTRRCPGPDVGSWFEQEVAQGARVLERAP